MAHVSGRVADAGFRPYRLGVETGSRPAGGWSRSPCQCRPDLADWRDAFVALQARGRVVFSAAIDGAVYAKHGTTFPTRLTVIDKLAADDPTVFPVSLGMAPDVATLLDWIAAHVPSRLPVSLLVGAAPISSPPPKSVRGYLARPSAGRPAAVAADPEGVELAYDPVDWTPPDART